MPWLAETDRLPFPVEWSMNLTVLDGDQAKKAVQRKLLVIRDMQKHYAEHGLDEPLALERQVEQARQVEDEMTTGRDVQATRVHGWYRVAVWGETREECRERARILIDRYRKRQVTIARPKGQWGLLREFIPGEPLSDAAYQRRLPALYFAAGVPQTASLSVTAAARTSVTRRRRPPGRQLRHALLHGGPGDLRSRTDRRWPRGRQVGPRGAHHL